MNCLGVELEVLNLIILIKNLFYGLKYKCSLKNIYAFYLFSLLHYTFV